MSLISRIRENQTRLLPNVSKVRISKLEIKTFYYYLLVFPSSYKRQTLNNRTTIVSVALTLVPGSRGSRSSLRTPARRN